MIQKLFSNSKTNTWTGYWANLQHNIVIEYLVSKCLMNSNVEINNLQNTLWSEKNKPSLLYIV